MTISSLSASGKWLAGRVRVLAVSHGEQTETDEAPACCCRGGSGGRSGKGGRGHGTQKYVII